MSRTGCVIGLILFAGIVFSTAILAMVTGEVVNRCFD